MRACGNRAAGRGCGAGAAGRASAACSCGGGRKGAVAVGGGRVAAARGELPGRSGLGDCVLPLRQWAAGQRLAQSARAAAPNFRLFLFWPEPRFLWLQAQPVALPSTRPPLGAVPRRRGAGRTPRPGSEALASPGLPARSSSDRGVGTPARGRRREVHFEELSDEFPRRESSLQRSGQDEPHGLVETFLTCFSRLRNCLTSGLRGSEDSRVDGFLRGTRFPCNCSPFRLFCFFVLIDSNARQFW